MSDFDENVCFWLLKGNRAWNVQASNLEDEMNQMILFPRWTINQIMLTLQDDLISLLKYHKMEAHANKIYLFLQNIELEFPITARGNNNNQTLFLYDDR